MRSYTLRTLIPDIQASYAVAPWFRVGAGVLMVAPLGQVNNFGWLFYINARFVLSFS